MLQGLLRDQLEFNGLIITDASPMVGFLCAMDRRKSVPFCIEAGCDMLLFNKDYNEDIMYMKEGYQKGILSPKRLDEAVTRILAMKAALKLHRKRAEGTLIPSRENLSVTGCKEHVAWARECADKSVTFVKVTQNLLPVSPAKHKRVLYQVIGNSPSEKRVADTFVKQMEMAGFTMIPYRKEEFDVYKPIVFETVEQFRSKYELVIYLGNVENASNKTTARLDWHTIFGAGNNIPWFVEVVPTMFISLQIPYHLLDVPMVKTYINAYSNHDCVIEAVF